MPDCLTPFRATFGVDVLQECAGTENRARWGIQMDSAAQHSEKVSGHPKGVYYLAFTETWERFSFYGMSALLTLYMVKRLRLSDFRHLGV
jgi:hypothetical protein